MSIVNIINLLGGLGLFLFGMRYMSDGINQVAGNKMKNLLEKLTSNRFKGFLLGVVVTAIIQSSSATTVMLMGFLNAGIMTLAQATGVILGANIGTTITAVLIAIDVSAIAPICIFVGIAFVLFAKKQTKKYIGQIILGFGVLFFGLKYMSGDSAMGVLKTSEAFQNFITTANNPVLGLIIGILMCSVLQSSSASIGVLQVLALQGLMPMSFAIYLIIGVNVGSAMPLFLSSIGAKTNAKRAAIIYFMFDLAGMLIFTPISLFTPFVDWISNTFDNGSVQVAAAHIIFKVVTALVLLPLIPLMVKLSEKIIRQKEHDTKFRFQYIDKRLNSNNSFASVLQSTKEVERMARLVRENLVLSCEGLIKNDISKAEKIQQNEELINWLNHNIADFMVTITSHEVPKEASEYLGKLFQVIADFERIGDHAINILEHTQLAVSDGLDFTSEGLSEFEEIYLCDLELYDRALCAFLNKSLSDSEETELHKIEDLIDKLTLSAQDNQVQRLREKKCHTAAGVEFTRILHDLERVGDHSYNIAWAARIDKNLLRQI